MTSSAPQLRGTASLVTLGPGLSLSSRSLVIYEAAAGTARCQKPPRRQRQGSGVYKCPARRHPGERGAVTLQRCSGPRARAGRASFPS